jgi:quercetin dioxygenase-like cupin family protein
MERQPLVVEHGRGEALAVMGAQVSFLCPAERTGKAWSLMEVTLPKDAGPPPHEHPWDEGYYVVAGAARFVLGTRELMARQGDFLYAPAGTVHGFQGASDDEPARVLVFDAPAAAEAFFRDAAAEVRELPRDLGRVPDIGSRHGIRFVRPE